MSRSARPSPAAAAEPAALRLGRSPVLGRLAVLCSTRLRLAASAPAYAAARPDRLVRHRLRRAAERRGEGEGDDHLPVRRRLRTARHRPVLRHPGEVRRHPGRGLHDRPHRRDQSGPGRADPVLVAHRQGSRADARSSCGSGSATRTRRSRRATATYVISYDITGAMRTFPSSLRRVLLGRHRGGLDRIDQGRCSIKVTVPGGVQDTTCTYGPVGSTTKCQQRSRDGVATFTQSRPGRRGRASPSASRSSPG